MVVTASPSAPPPLGILLSFSGAGGVERMVMNLVGEFAARGLALDLLTIRADSAHFDGLPDNIRWVPLRSRHALTSVPEIARYLRQRRPRALLVAKDRAARAALVARRISGTRTPVVVRLGTNLSTALEVKHPLQRWLRTAPMRWLYRDVDRVVAVSRGVAEDIRRITGLPASRVEAIPNPVITRELASLAAAPCPHPWLGASARAPRVPVVLASGRLTAQKGFDTLLRAFARLRGARPARLIILGEGRQRAALEALARDLGIQQDLLLPGFRKNPYAWLSRADLFVLSSRWEGSPNVLTEALALGIPGVATRCPSGPDEILQGGRFGPLVAIDDDEQLARAMSNTLDHPLPAHVLREAVAGYNAAHSADRYLAALGYATQDRPPHAAV